MCREAARRSVVDGGERARFRDVPTELAGTDKLDLLRLLVKSPPRGEEGGRRREEPGREVAGEGAIEGNACPAGYADFDQDSTTPCNAWPVGTFQQQAGQQIAAGLAGHHAEAGR